MGAIGRFFAFWTRATRRYDKLKNDERLRESSADLGVRAIVRSLICGALFCGFIWLAALCVKDFQSVQAGNGGTLLSILGIVVGLLGAFFTFVQGAIGGLIYLVYQFKLNRKPVRWVALAVWLIVVVGTVVFAVLMLTGA